MSIEPVQAVAGQNTDIISAPTEYVPVFPGPEWILLPLPGVTCDVTITGPINYADLQLAMTNHFDYYASNVTVGPSSA